MGTTGGSVSRGPEFDEWFNRAQHPWNPVSAASRQFDALTAEGDAVADAEDYDDLFDVANLAVQWLEANPCPDTTAARHLRAQMMGFRAVADTVRSTLIGADGDVMVARLWHLREVIEQHALAIEGSDYPELRQPIGVPRSEDRFARLRRDVPRQTTSWEGFCLLQGDAVTDWQACRIIDISMAGLGLTLNHDTPSGLLGQWITVEVAAVDDLVNVRLDGRIAHAAPTLRGDVRIGVAFEGLFDAAKDDASLQPAVASRSDVRQGDETSPTLRGLVRWLDSKSAERVLARADDVVS